jgi:hypothetical protein
MLDTPTPVDLAAVETPEASFEAALAAAVATAAPEEANAPQAEAPVPAAPVVPAAVVAPVAAVPAPDLRLGELEAELASTKAALEAARAAPPPTAFDWAAFEADPVGTIRRAKPDLSPAQAAKVAEELYMDALGDAAPIEYRMKKQIAQVKESPEVVELRNKVSQLEQSNRAAQIAAYQGELRSHGAQLAADAYPVLSNLAKRDPDTFTEILYEVALQESRASGWKVTLSPAQAAERAEKLLVAQRDKLYGPAPAPSTSVASAPSLFAKDLAEQPSRSAPAELDDKALRAAALKAAGIDVPVW